MQSAHKAVCNSSVAPVVYDALIVLRPSSHLVDSVAVPSRMSSLYLTELPSNDSVIAGMLHLTCAHLPSASAWSSKLHETQHSASNITHTGTRNGMVSVYLLARSYANCLVCEISQLCYGGIYRAIALGSSNGLSTSKSKVISIFRPVMVPVGKLCLGRVFNVTGTSIDGYIQLSMLSDQFGLGYVTPLHDCTTHISHSAQRQCSCFQRP